jgi:DNA polymerase-3 subunit delta'
MTPLFGDIIGQERAVEILEKAVVAAHARDGSQSMVQSWLFTGPPGSGRSHVALAFAAALLCDAGGCGVCHSCHLAHRGSHPDLEVIRTEGLSLKIDEVREIIGRASWEPSSSPFRVVVIEDAERLTESAANALLKAIEEPGVRTIWLLCSPTVEDVLPTIRSRCRQIALITPSTAAVAALLVREESAPDEIAKFAARASQGHIGRARFLVREPDSRARRDEVINLALQLSDVAGAMAGAARLMEIAGLEATSEASDRDEVEREELAAALGAGGSGKGTPSGSSKALKDLEKEQKSRITRATRDSIDRALLDIATAYRDVLVVQMGVSEPRELINEHLRKEIEARAANSNSESVMQRWEEIMATRRKMKFNVAPLLALEALLLKVRF